MVLEFTATGAPELGVGILNTYRASLELLRIGLAEDKLPHEGVVAAICDVLGGPSPKTRAEVRDPSPSPPTETVGLEPTFLPYPQLQGACDEVPAVGRPALRRLPDPDRRVDLALPLHQFGWTTRSSQLYESKLLKIGSPLFHFALIAAVLMGHLVGLLIPKAFTDWIGLSQHAYHLGAFWGGGLAGVALIVGLVLLIVRRRTTGAVFKATTWNDKFMYLVLATVIGLGMVATLTGDKTPTGAEHNYPRRSRSGSAPSSPFQPDVDAMAAATWQFQTHVVVGTCCCSRSSRSPAWCTPSRRRSTTCSAPTSSTGRATSPHAGPPRRVAAGTRSAPATTRRCASRWAS